jgi:hypothetical protein
VKLQLKTGETAIICDFSENYSINQGKGKDIPITGRGGP